MQYPAAGAPKTRPGSGGCGTLFFAFFSFGQARRALRRMMPCLRAGLFESARLIRFSSGAISRNHFPCAIAFQAGKAARPAAVSHGKPVKSAARQRFNSVSGAVRERFGSGSMASAWKARPSLRLTKIKLLRRAAPCHTQLYASIARHPAFWRIRPLTPN